MKRLLRSVPSFTWRRLVNRQSVAADARAALTGALVSIPQGIAFAAIAGLPPEYGLYTAMIPVVIAAIFGSSWHVVSGPTTPISIVVFSMLTLRAEAGSEHYIQLALALTLIVGVMQLVVGLMRMGVLVDFISHAVLVGFTAGAAILITISQADAFIGLSLPSQPHAYQSLGDVIAHVPDINSYALGIGIIAIGVTLLGERHVPAVPGLMLGLVAASITAAILEAVLSRPAELTYVTSVAAAFPPFAPPAVGFDDLLDLIPPALAMTVLTLTQTMSIARALAIQSGQRLDANREIVGQGLSNIAGGMFSSYVSSGSFNRSALNFQLGARTPLAAIYAGLFLMVGIGAVAPLVHFIPMSGLAGILFLVSWRLVDVARIRRILRASPDEAVIMALTFFSAIMLSLEFAIILGVLGSLFLFIFNASRPRIVSKVPDPASPKRSFVTDPSLPECPQLKIVRIDGSLFFGAVHHIQKMLSVFESRNAEQKHLLIDGSGVVRIDISGAELLAEEARQRRARGGRLYLYGMNDRIRELLGRGGYAEAIGEGQMFDTKARAIEHIVSNVDHDICRRCTVRAFIECERYRPDGEQGVESTDGVGAER